MIFRPKGRDDCCCKSWKDKINELWEKYQGVVKGVKAGSVTAYPDGDGIADLDGAVADAIAQQVPPMLTDLVTETELSTALEDYPTETDLSQTLEDYATQQDLETKQDVLVSGQTIRTINGRDLLGEGNLQFNDVLPDFSQAAEGDALVIGSEGLPEWGEVSTGYEFLESVSVQLSGLSQLKISVSEYMTNIINDDTDYLITFDKVKLSADGDIEPIFVNGNVDIGMRSMNQNGIDAAAKTRLLLINNLNVSRLFVLDVLSKPGSGKVTIIPYGAPLAMRGGVNGAFLKFSNNDYNYELGKLVSNPGTNYQSGSQYKVLRATGSSSFGWYFILPEYSSANAGQVLSVNSQGQLEWITLP